MNELLFVIRSGNNRSLQHQSYLPHMSSRNFWSPQILQSTNFSGSETSNEALNFKKCCWSCSLKCTKEMTIVWLCPCLGLLLIIVRFISKHSGNIRINQSISQSKWRPNRWRNVFFFLFFSWETWCVEMGVAGLDPPYQTCISSTKNVTMSEPQNPLCRVKFHVFWGF